MAVRRLVRAADDDGLAGGEVVRHVPARPHQLAVPGVGLRKVVAAGPADLPLMAVHMRMEAPVEGSLRCEKEANPPELAMLRRGVACVIWGSSRG